PWKYLGWKLINALVSPQKLTLNRCIYTLNDLQKLLGKINWICPSLGMTTEELSPLL
ncbi:POK18 protein, partial [Trogon melanurus]|nr:POK18 protein [Trogon melanurus]